MPAREDLLLFAASVIDDPVTTTDELILQADHPSLELMRLAEYLSKKTRIRCAGKAAVSEPIPRYVEKAIESIKSGSKPQVGSVISQTDPATARQENRQLPASACWAA